LQNYPTQAETGLEWGTRSAAKAKDPMAASISRNAAGSSPRAREKRFSGQIFLAVILSRSPAET